MSRPLASVVITSYNYGRFLRDAIDSALSQTYRPTEVVVVDDGSHDDSPLVIRSYGDRILAILRQHEGPAAVVNAGFAASGGEIVLFLDSDDYLAPMAVETAVGLLSDPGTAKVHWPLWEVDRSGIRTGRLVPRQALAEGGLRELVIREGPGCYVSAPTSGNAWGRPFLERIFPVPDIKHVDSYLEATVALFGAIRRVTDPQGYYRLHGENDFGSRPESEKNVRNLESYEHQCRLVTRHLRDQGIRIEPDAWKKSSVTYQWMYWQHLATEEVAALVPAGGTFILVDEDNWGANWPSGEVIRDRRALPFMEQNGEYWGPPEDSTTAIREVERLLVAGAQFMVFAWPAFWWLDYYVGLRTYLRARFRCLLEDERVIVFDLRACEG